MTEDPVHGADESYVSSRTPDDGVTPKAEDVEPATPEEFGSVQLRWGDGKGETTAASRVGVDAVGHGYRVHVPQFMKRGVTSVEEIRGEYDTIGTTPRISDGNSGHYGWHGLRDGTDADAHASRVHRGLERARELLASRGDSDLESAPPIDRSSEDGVSMLILDEIRYAVTRDLIGP
ncbi:MAG: cob(I)yrinic acid a,c-diamide adenosyltransferase, partial [Haloplanus sp.]